MDADVVGRCLIGALVGNILFGVAGAIFAPAAPTWVVFAVVLLGLVAGGFLANGVS